jgi:hypothetical protein
MSLRHSCYISYRGGRRKLAERFIREFSKALQIQLDQEAYNRYQQNPSTPVYTDLSRLQHSEPEEETQKELATAMCESACMILIFTPNYFSTAYPYCAREYKAMEQLEKERLDALGMSLHVYQEQSPSGMILPVIFRGSSYLPEELKRRFSLNFEDFLLSDESMARHPQLIEKLEKIAQYVLNWQEKLTSVEAQKNCEKFKFPSEKEIQPWLQEITASKSRNFSESSTFTKTALNGRVKGLVK